MRILISITAAALIISSSASANDSSTGNKVKLINSRIAAEDAPRPNTLNGMEARTIDGTNNNLANPNWGAADEQLLRIGPADYADGISDPSGVGRPSAREISNTVHTQTSDRPNSLGASDYLWQWGQFLDHDIDLTDLAAPAEPFNIAVPMGDPFFDPGATGTQEIAMDRAGFDPATGTGAGNPREQLNNITAYIDASNVYGSDPVRADTLRSNDGSGRLNTSAGNLLPFNTSGLPNAGGTGAELFLAGDVRVNEQLGLTSMHTLFMREHNRLAAQIAADNPGATGDEIYETARAIVGAQMQVISYNEFLPLLLGPGSLSAYTGYSPAVNAGISNEFSTAAYRLGHTMLSSQIQRRSAVNVMIPEGPLPLRDAFFAPQRLNDGGIDPILRGLAAQDAQDVDAAIVDDVRNFLFGPPGGGGFDLASLNIQRGRDHGLPGYNDMRVAFGLPAVASFAEITSDAAAQAALASAYATVDDIDPWTGALIEDDLPGGGLVGPLLNAVLVDQFERLRDGDRFWYQLVFSGSELAELGNTTLADIIRRNTAIGEELPDLVFFSGLNNALEVPATSRLGLLIIVLLIMFAGWAGLNRRANGQLN